MTARLRRRALAGGALVAVLGVAAWARLSDARSVLRDGISVPVDGDSAYHVHRILHAVARFPELPTVDPAMNWPAGGACPWADGFDLLGAALALALGGRGDRARAELAASLLPVIVGLAVVVAAMALARRVARRGNARGAGLGPWTAAGLFTAVLPQAVASARFGRVDHHVAEALSMLLLALWALRREPAGAVARAAGIRHELAGAATVAFTCWMFTGGPLYVALAAAGVLVRALASRRPAWLGSGAPGLLLGGVVTALLTLPAVRQHGRAVSFQLPSLLQPSLVVVAAAGVAAAVLTARRLPRAGPAARAAACAAAIAASVVALGVASPAMRAQVVEGLRGWLFHRDPWLAGIDEFQPMLGGGRGVVAPLRYFFGAPGVLAPALLAAGSLWAVRRTGGRGAVFAGLSVAVFALALVQSRFGRVAAPFLAVNAALALEYGAAWAARAARRPRALAAVVACAAAVAVSADSRLRAMLRPVPARSLPAEAAASLELRGDPVPGAADPGVLAPWSIGHAVSLLSGRPVVVNGFGTYLDAATFWEAQEALGRTAPDAVDAWLARRRVGFVLAGVAHPTTFVTPDGRGPLREGRGGIVLDPDAMRAIPMSPLIVAGSGIPAAGVPHLAHLMPVFASEQIAEGLAFPLPLLWGYARVPGARVTGRSGPGARVVVEVPFVERGRPHVYRAWGDAGPDGRWEIVVPLPTGLARPTLRSAERAALRAGSGDAVSLEVPRDAVLRGDVVEAPPLPAGADG